MMVGAGRHDLKDWPKAVDAGHHRADLAELIAAISCLDAVVGPDLAMLHLAGALGRSGAVACHRPWAWANREGRSRWYPTLRVVTRSRPGSWDDAVAALRTEVARLVAQGGAPGLAGAAAPR